MIEIIVLSILACVITVYSVFFWARWYDIKIDNEDYLQSPD